MALRDKVVGVFGLKTSSGVSEEQRNVASYRFEPGEQLGIFRLYNKSEKELVMGEDGP